jgi:hypothetical protein
VPVCRQLHRSAADRAKPPSKKDDLPGSGAIGVVLRELWSLFVDDVWLAVGILVLVGAAWLTQTRTVVSAVALCLFFAGSLNAVLALSTARRARE